MISLAGKLPCYKEHYCLLPSLSWLLLLQVYQRDFLTKPVNTGLLSAWEQNLMNNKVSSSHHTATLIEFGFGNLSKLSKNFSLLCYILVMKSFVFSDICPILPLWNWKFYASALKMTGNLHKHDLHSTIILIFEFHFSPSLHSDQLWLLWIQNFCTTIIIQVIILLLYHSFTEDTLELQLLFVEIVIFTDMHLFI